ncbi:hepatoma-derived growth factor-related protein 2-like [Galendromus occidentalis]|uniref:Hepatoma-derived growth factor-related protein 2-like n=1 Tax=Galendromus occidentalis TaxID=34638 RepID=A0AAJ7SH94_9ACAR|nr:hepatoma-derived growth factor-related protein 2-like [Galendromus occidentalis]
MAKNDTNFKAGSLVFAKLRGFPYWPARVESKVEGTYYVYFFGTHETTALNMSNLLPFNDETKKKYGRIKRKFFAEAMDTIQKDPNFKADCVFNIPGTTVKKTPAVKPATTQRKRKPVESITQAPPKAPRDPPKRRSPPPGGLSASIAKRERKESKRDSQEAGGTKKTISTDKKSDEILVPNSFKKDSQETAFDAEDSSKKGKSTLDVVERAVPVVYEYLNSERSLAEMGRLPLIKRREPPRDAPAASNEDAAASTAAAAPTGKNEQEAFSSPIKKRKLSPPKKAPERYLEDAPQRRNSVQKKDAVDMRTADDSSLDTSSKSTTEPKAAKITKRSSGSQAGNKRSTEKVIEYTPGQLVFAKVKGYPFWPARVNGIASNAKPVKYNIFFYGTHERAKLTAKDLLPVNAETKERYGKPNKRSQFSEGLVEMKCNQWVEYPGSFVSSQPSEPISSSTVSTTNTTTSAAAAAAAATAASSAAPTRPVVESSPTKIAGSAQQEPQLPPVTLVPQLNVQLTSPHSPQGSSQKTGSDKEDSDSYSDSSDSVGCSRPEMGEQYWRLLGNK